ncbi:MAG: hypothetical protein AB1717_08070 [Pseudomonadota bacterium]
MHNCLFTHDHAKKTKKQPSKTPPKNQVEPKASIRPNLIEQSVKIRDAHNHPVSAQPLFLFGDLLKIL